MILNKQSKFHDSQDCYCKETGSQDRIVGLLSETTLPPLAVCVFIYITFMNLFFFFLSEWDWSEGSALKR